VEKENTTPDYYPLSLNALVNACNQKSNREPVMSLSDGEVIEALDSLGSKGLAGARSSAESRVTKYEHRLQEVFNFSRGETAVLCVLLLRGPQTPGGLRARGERIHRFDDLAGVQSALNHLMSREPPFVKMLARMPGTKEARYAHLFSGDVTAADAPVAAVQMPPSLDSARMAQLEAEVASLREEFAELKQQLSDLKKQFE
jgi:uncharacterized protein